MKVKSKINGLVIGHSSVTAEVTKLGKEKFAHVTSDTKTASKSQAKRVASQKKAAPKKEEATVEQL